MALPPILPIFARARLRRPGPQRRRTNASRPPQAIQESSRFDQLPLPQREGWVTGNGASETARESSAQHSIPASPLVSHETPTDSFEKFGQVATAIASTAANWKSAFAGRVFAIVQAASLPTVVTWFTGTPFAATENKVMQLAGPRCAKLFARGRRSLSTISTRLLKHSDLGETAFEIFAHRPIVVHSCPSLDGRRILQALRARGPSAKLPILIEVLEQCSPLEAKFLVKILTSDLRIGLKEGLVEEAVSQAFAAFGGRSAPG